MSLPNVDRASEHHKEGERAGRRAVLHELLTAARRTGSAADRLEAMADEVLQAEERDARDLGLELLEIAREVRR